MRNIVLADYNALGRRAADIVCAALQRKPDLLFCASAGSTPTGLYEELATRYSRRPKLFSKMRVLQVDEWFGLPRSNPASCEIDLLSKLVVPLRIATNRFIGFRTDAPDPERDCARIAAWLDQNAPIDICILGLGLNGHVAMNEPGPKLYPHAHVARLTRSSLQHTMLSELPGKPTRGLTLGLADILASRAVLLLVNGRHKRAALERTLSCEISTQFPASFLWLHPNTTVLCDRAAWPYRSA